MAKVAQMISVKEAADLLKISTVRLRSFINDGRLKAIRVGKSFVLNRTDVLSMPRLPAGRPPKQT
jgi:excisionase family DNA binding protein